jgi:hypothetical protein
MDRGTDTGNHPERPRIFGIGLNKTGTSTLDQALKILGFSCLHFGGQAAHDAVKRAIDEGTPLLTYLDPRYDAFSDIGLLSRRFRMLDAQYPGSKFILTVRPREAWIDSRRRHVERNVLKQSSGDYDGTFVVVDEEKWRNEWDLQMSRAHQYFDARDNFLEVDFTQHPEWRPLCEFLGVAVPATSFPWVNRDESVAGVSPGTKLRRAAARLKPW